MDSAFQILLFVGIMAFFVWAVEQVVPMQPQLKRIFEVVVIVIVVVVVINFLLAVFGIASPFPHLRLF